MDTRTPSHRPLSRARALLRKAAGLLALGSAFLAGAAWGDTNVSGTISQNATWLASDSPYVVTSDLYIDNGAVLSIEPGVTVKFAAGASLAVKNGGLTATGLTEAPVVLTSNKSTPAAGDWGQLRFQAGTIASSTRLQNAVVEYGSGVVIEKSAPQFVNVSVRNHRGAAMTVDLAASPTGTGLSASGNDINGVLVPAGTIVNTVEWGLVGIPYVLAQGLIQVGQAPIMLEPAALTLNPGVLGTMRVSTASEAPDGGWTITLTSSVPSAATTPASVTVPAGSNWADFPITAQGLGETTITASHANFGTTTSSVRVASLPALQLQPSHATIGVNRAQPMTVRLPQPTTSALTVLLTSSDAAKVSVPSSVTVPAGGQTAPFDATGLLDGSVIVSAQATGYAGASAAITVRSRALVLPLSVVVTPGATLSVPITLTEPAPPEGLTITLTSSASSIASVPASVTVAAGSISTSANLQGVATGSATLTATAPNYQQATTTATVQEIALDFDPAGNISIPQGLTYSRRVRLSKPAPVGGLSVTLSTDGPGNVTIEPTEVYVPQGQTVATAPALVRGIAKGSGTVTLSAAGLASKSVAVSVTDPASLIVRAGGGSRTTSVVGKGMQTYFYDFYVFRVINGSSFSGPEAVTVNLSTSDAGKLSLPAKITIPAGSGAANFTVVGRELGSDIAVTASADGYASSGTPVTVAVVQPSFAFQSLDGYRSVESGRDDFYVDISTPSAYSTQTAAADITVDVALTGQAPAGVVSGIYDAAAGGNAITQAVIRAGETQALTANRGKLYIERPSTPGTYTVTAAATGLTSGVSAVQTVSAPALRLRCGGGSSSTGKVGKGMRSYAYDCLVERIVNGVALKGSQPLTVSLSSADPAKVAVPATVDIPAGQSIAYFYVTGVELSGGTTVTASAPGHDAPTTPVTVQVVQPTLAFSGLDNFRSVESGRDNFYVNISTPGSYSTQTAATQLIIDLAITDQSPEGVVAGIYDAVTAGNLKTGTVINAGFNESFSSESKYAYVGRPLSGGQYTVTATIPGTTSVVSSVQTVTAPSLRVRARGGSAATTTVGKGMRTYSYDLYVERLANGVPLAGADPLTVTLISSDPAKVRPVQTDVQIDAGQSFAYFLLEGVENGEGVTITTSAAGYTPPTAPVTVSVVTPTITFSALDGSRSTESIRDNFYVNLSVPGAYGTPSAARDHTVGLSITDQTPSGIVAGLYDAATAGNAKSQTVIKTGYVESYSSAGYLYIERPTMTGTYTVAAAIPGVASAVSGVQTVFAPGLKLSGGGGSSTKVVVGNGLKTYTYDARIDRDAGGQPFLGMNKLTVNLACAASSVCNVPATVDILAGQSTAYFPVMGVGEGSTVVTASVAGYLDSNDLAVQVVPATLAIHDLATTVTAGSSDNFYVSIKVPGGYSNPAVPTATTVTLTTAIPAVGTVTPQVTVAAGGNSSGWGTFSGIAPGTTSVTASSPGIEPATSSTITVK